MVGAMWVAGNSRALLGLVGYYWYRLRRVAGRGAARD